MGSKKKTYPRILSNEIYTYISNHTDLSKRQVADCFREYRNMIVGIIESNYTPKDLAILLPNMGEFYFREKKGRKDGSTYYLYGQPIIAQNELSYLKLMFKVRTQIRTLLKEKTKHHEE